MAPNKIIIIKRLSYNGSLYENMSFFDIYNFFKKGGIFMDVFDDLKNEKESLKKEKFFYEIRERFREESEDETPIKKVNVPKKELSRFVYKIKEDSSIYETKKENSHLKKLVEELQIENKKLYETKYLINEYKKVMNQKNRDIERLIVENEKLNASFEKIPNFIRKIFVENVN